MPFTLTNVLETFKSLVNQIFRPFIRRCVLVFFYDILVYSPDLATHIIHLGAIFNVLRNNSLYTNPKKCVFLKKRIEYLGHWVSVARVGTDSKKIKVRLQWELHEFLGLTGYYRRFGTISAPLTQLLKKDAFKWETEATMAFDKLKNAMVTLSVLALPDFTVPFFYTNRCVGNMARGSALTK